MQVLAEAASGAAVAAGFVIVLAAALALYNNVIHRVPRFEAFYVPINLTTTAAVLAAGIGAGLGRDDLGLDAESLAAGSRWGLAAAAVILVGLLVVAAVPSLRPWLDDARVTTLSPGRVAYAALIRIPLGTVVLEEVAFRGVLFGAWMAVAGTEQAVIGSSLVFGIWHVRPTLEAIRLNRPGTPPSKVVRLTAGGVAATALVGVFFALLRVVSGSLLAPVLVHFAANSLATGAAFVAAGRPPSGERSIQP